MESYDNSFNSRIDKKKLLYKMGYFPQPNSYGQKKIKVELDLSNYATKFYLKMQQPKIHRSLLKRLN